MIPVMMQEILEEANVFDICLEENKHVFQEIVGEYKKRNIRFIIIAGRGTSDHAAVYAKYIYETLLKKPVSLAAPSISTIFDTKLDTGKDTLFIGISQSGCAEDVTNVIKDARGSGSLTISITNAPDSLLAKAAEYSLNCHAGLEKSVAATKTFSATLQIIAGLAAYLQDDKALIQKLTDMDEWVQEAYKLQPKIRELVKKFRTMKECVVLSRGYTYPIALEMALKLQECTYVKADGLSVSDFMHGPIAMINRGAICFLIADKGPFFEQYIELYKKLCAYGAKVLLITNDAEVARNSKLSLLVPNSQSAIVSPLIYTTVIQIFVYLLALQKGLNPDVPRNLSKVTITR